MSGSKLRKPLSPFQLIVIHRDAHKSINSDCIANVAFLELFLEVEGLRSTCFQQAPCRFVSTDSPKYMLEEIVLLVTLLHTRYLLIVFLNLSDTWVIFMLLSW